jgi:O-antigen/teichoic acid export membrane protein
VSLKRNVIANLGGSAWSALMALAFVPFYIRLMGAEAFGVVGIFVSVQALFAVLDMGLSAALAREMARLSGLGEERAAMADTARTIEAVYWVVAGAIGVAVFVLSEPIAHHWLNPGQLTRDTVEQAISIMALVVALRWPVALYMGGLNGLQRQVLANALLATFATLQGAGALLALLLFEPTVLTFFLWQAVIAAVQVVACRGAYWRAMAPTARARVDFQVLRRVWRFAAGLAGTSLLVTVLTQADKVLLSRLLSLEDFGYYTFAATVAAAIYKLVSPIHIAYYPRLVELVARRDDQGLRRTYHQGCQWVAVFVVPAATVFGVFSGEILDLWTSDAALVGHTHLLVSILVLGNALNALMYLPYAAQLAHGWSSLGFQANLAALVMLVPALYFSALQWGAVGAAGAWVALNIGYVLITPHLMHRRILIGEKASWYWRDLGLPLLSSGLVVALGAFFFDLRSGSGFDSKFETLLVLAVTSVVALGAVVLVTAEPRSAVLRRLRVNG